MKLSTRTRYGFRAILDLAMYQGKGPIQLKVIARNQQISIKYLEQLIAILKSAGLVRSVRGAKGGYVLARTPQEIRVSDVFFALEGPSAISVECIEDKDACARVLDCIARDVWVKVQDAIIEVLKSMTLQDLLDKAGSKKEFNYQI
jgi:Rrf2 family protein